MKHTDLNAMYAVDYEAHESKIREYMNGRELEALCRQERSGSVRITGLIQLGSAKK